MKTSYLNFFQENVMSDIGIDESETGTVLRGMTLLGRVSRNNRVYSEQALLDAVRLYEGAPYFVDHPQGPENKAAIAVRSVRDLAGKVSDVRRDGDMVRGDVHLIKGVPLTEQIVSIARTMPDKAGNSHRISGKATTPKRNGDPMVIEGIDKVFGVDLVTEPATTGGMFESEQSQETEKTPMTLEELKKDHPEIVAAIIEEAGKENDTESRIAALETKLAEKDEKIDAYEVKEKLAEKKAMVAEKLDEAKLPKELVTEKFKEQLEKCDDEKDMDALIEDRRSLIPHVKKSKSFNVEKKIDKMVNDDEIVTEDVDDAAFQKYAIRMFA